MAQKQKSGKICNATMLI